MADNYRETLTKNAELRVAYSHAAAAQHDGDVGSDATLEFYDENGRKFKKSGTTISNELDQVNSLEWHGRVNHIDETNGGASAQVGWARIDKDNAAFNIVAAEEEDLDVVVKQAIIIDSITWNQRTGQTSVFNAHNFSAQLNVDGTIIEAGSHYVCSDGAGESVKTLNSGNGVAVPAGSILQIETPTGGTIAAGDDVYGLEWVIVYRRV